MHVGSEYEACDDEHLFLRFHIYVTWKGAEDGADMNIIHLKKHCADSNGSEDDDCGCISAFDDSKVKEGAK